MLGVVATPELPATLGVVIVVGGPQYRVGSHRQFVLLARALAREGIACMRFDLRGMGDSGGARTDFEHADADIRAAIDALCSTVPRVQRVVLWGLCDGASASAFYVGQDRRVAGLALFNPWVRTEAGAAKAALTDYYGKRVLDRAFWRKLVSGGVDVRRSLSDGWRSVRRAARKPPTVQVYADLPARMGAALARHAGPALVALSEHDLVAAEFRHAAAGGSPLAQALTRSQIVQREFAGSDHTFSTAEALTAASDATIDWLRSSFAQDLATGTPGSVPRPAGS